ncbi:2-hydroxyacid dehydrogenase [Bosea sp. (in: a-proteobacteria)]|uniref:2-hydroxyacid dehydrogenase n=1 Tax=Bosea sp. (in: a-proteobacteria) TaxID=1871050 RepID=UPI001213A218|nr:2-hydroxyacid dehydrogenase [Bosea sp. (in: a-proteobacteria)]TAJ29695.1 MAG: 2-hydroxyacid dehydrogenase [Bosea sp. (in: a-proteobacteria)]
MASSNAPEIVMTGPLMAYAADQLKERFVVHELWKAADRDALLREIADRVRGVAAGGGHNRVDAALFDALPKLEIVASFGVGYDHVDAAEAGRRGLIVTNTPDVLTDEVADLAIGLLLATVRQLPQVDRYLREGKWLKGAYPLTTSLRKRSVGIVGLGRIGKAVAHRLEAFGLPVAYHGRSRQADVAYRYYPSLIDMAADVDTLISVAPGGASTHHIINAEVLKALGPNGILVNVGRGTVVDEAALIKALQDKTILSAGLDVFEDEPRVPADLIAMDHVVLLPHVGSASVHTREQMGQLLVDNLVSWFEGKGPKTPVPETPVRDR